VTSAKDPSYQDWKDSISRLIRYRMKAMELTLEDLAGISGLPFDYVRRAAAGERYPSHKARKMMESALGCSLEFVEPKKDKS
jgi:transcriptional regulator with XRE-family HTH domain